jgi:hypothetical protein
MAAPAPPPPPANQPCGVRADRYWRPPPPPPAAQVHGIGPARARQLADELGVDSVEELRRAAAAGRVQLSRAQQLGLRHHADFAQRIPRMEVSAHPGTHDDDENRSKND